MKLIVGLGNPDEKYKNTFHNLGFMGVDAVAKKLGTEFNKTKCKALTAETIVDGEKIIIAKPQTYMNLSGESVSELINFYKLSLKDIVVIYDDYDLTKGLIRVRGSGTAGTHNGMRNIVELLGDTNFARIRVGFKPTDNFNIPLIDLVLSGIKNEDKDLFSHSIDRASNCAIDFVKGESIDILMQKYNCKG